MKLGRERFDQLPVEVRDAIEAALPDEREKFKAAVAPLRRNREVDSAMSPGPELFEQDLFAVDSEWPAACEFYEEYSSSTTYRDWLPDAKSTVANLFERGARAASREQFASRDQREAWLKGKLLPAVLESMTFDRWAKEAIEGNRPQDIYVRREDLGKNLPAAYGPKSELLGDAAQDYLRIRGSPHGELEVILHYAGLSHQLGPETRDAVEDELRTHLLQLVSHWTQNFGRAVEPKPPETALPPPASMAASASAATTREPPAPADRQARQAAQLNPAPTPSATEIPAPVAAETAPPKEVGEILSLLPPGEPPADAREAAERSHPAPAEPGAAPASGGEPQELSDQSDNVLATYPNRALKIKALVALLEPKIKANANALYAVSVSRHGGYGEPDRRTWTKLLRGDYVREDSIDHAIAFFNRKGLKLKRTDIPDD